jgi:hypothetical protein
VNERVTPLTHFRMMFILGGENVMEPDQTFEVVSYITNKRPERN